MAETIRRRWAPILGALLIVALATRADASGARLRWQPSADPRVTGYHVYMRAGGQRYTAAIDAGRPAPQADGNIAYVVSGLTNGQTYYFAVTAYSAVPLESALSQEVHIGTPNPCVIDRCTSTSSCEFRVAADGSSCDDGLYCNGLAICQGGVCQNGAAPDCNDGVPCTIDRCDEELARCVHDARSGCCTSAADCIGNDVCSSNPRCIAGSCQSTSSICPAAACAASFCDPISGCGLMPSPDGVTCELCGVLQPRKIVVGADDRQASLIMRATFVSDEIVDPSTDGLTLQLTGPDGLLLYSASVPAQWFLSKNESTKFRFLAHDVQAQTTTNGITGVTLRQRRGSWSLMVRGASFDLLNAVGEPQIAATLSFGAVCMSDAQIECDAQSSGAICR